MASANVNASATGGLKGLALGGKIDLVSAVVALVALVYYCISAPGVNNFAVVVPVLIVLGVCAEVAYALIKNKWADLLSLVAVVLLVAAIAEVAISSINTFADVLSGITMFGSQGGIEWIVAVIVMLLVATVLEQVSCFMRRSK